MENVIGMVASVGYVLAVLAVSGIMARRGAAEETTRKLVHIALGGWWFIAASFFTSAWWAAALPAAFIAVNAYSYRTQALSFMEREGGEETPGTVYYAISLTLLAFFSFWIGAPFVGALGFFCMAFGDGLAAVMGRRYGRRAIGFASGKKSVLGSAVMFAVSFVACTLVLQFAGLTDGIAIALVLAVAATALEMFSPAGLDNLTVPIGVSALYLVLFAPAAAYNPVLVGMLLSGVIVLASLRFGLLTLPGGAGALVVGTLAFAIGGWPLWLLLMWFFGSSNIASKVMARVTKRDSRKHHERRKLRQVLANGVPFLVCAAAYAVVGDPWLLIVSAGALAACTADTWASEIGTYSENPPINILTRERMQRGLSGGVSALGLGATVVGSAATAFLAMLLFHLFDVSVPTGPDAFLFIIACGVAGSLVDSVLGAAVQAKYRTPGKSALVESYPSGAGSTAQLVSGYSWMTNDAVNLISGGIVVAIGLFVVI